MKLPDRWMNQRKKKMREYKEIRTTRRDPGYEFRLLAYKITELTWLFFIILEVLIGLRVVMKLIGANPASLFVGVLYGVTGIFLIPFAGMINNPTFGSMVLEISSIIAMIVYVLVGWIVDRLIYLVLYWPVPATRNRQTVITDRTPSRDVVEVTQPATNDRISRPRI
jgi:hypothetical protein